MANSCTPDSIKKIIKMCFKSESHAKKVLPKIIELFKKETSNDTPKKVAKKKTPKKVTLKARENCDIKKQTECSEKNKECNPKTNRCIKKKTKKVAKKKTPKKLSLKARQNCDIERQTECYKQNKECNPKTNRCIKKKTKKVAKKKTPTKAKKQTKKKTPTKAKTPGDNFADEEFKVPEPIKKKDSVEQKKDSVEQIPDNTPQYNKDLRNSLMKPGLDNKYSPSINRDLKTLKSLSPVGAQGCKNEDIKDPKTEKCYSWKSKRARNTMLRNLVSKKPIDCKTVTAPKQLLSNCWFNSFFVTFFISDKGRKFNRWLREAMITGIMANGQPVPQKLRKPLFLLNKYIDASLHPKYNKTDFASLMNTNNIIKDVHKAISKKVNKKGKTLIAKVDVPSNPFSFYSGLYTYLGEDLMHWIKIRVDEKDDDLDWLKSEVSWAATQKDGTPTHPLMPKVIFLEIFDDVSKTFNKPLDFTVNSIKNGENIKCKYVLDSAVLRNTEKFHFSAYLTCNGKDFSFDGESFSRMSPFDWKSKINRDVEWKTSKYDTRFNFQKGYQLLIYYLDEISK
jgi:hypothetical protein